MFSTLSRRCRRAALIACPALITTMAPLTTAAQQVSAPAGLAAPAEPPRRGVSRSAPAPPPELPAGATALAPDTWRVTARSIASGRQEADVVQIVSRSVDRVHVALANGDEWLFERNPIDHRRVSGFAILHGTRVVVAYADSDLRNLLGLSGWAQVITFGCRTAALAPASCASRDGRSQLSLTRVRQGADARLLSPAAERFPTYREVDVADWLEEH